MRPFKRTVAATGIRIRYLRALHIHMLFSVAIPTNLALRI